MENLLLLWNGVERNQLKKNKFIHFQVHVFSDVIHVQDEVYILKTQSRK